jgi:hypothetical protein
MSDYINSNQRVDIHCRIHGQTKQFRILETFKWTRICVLITVSQALCDGGTKFVISDTLKFKPV